MKINFDIFKLKAEEWGIDLTDDKLSQFEHYYDQLIIWNEKVNLTAITDPEEVIKKHFLDSLSIAAVMDLNSVSSIIDVGTGAGFPGLPLKLAFPHLSVTLLDSLNKRITFLNTLIGDLSLADIEAVHGRAENVSREIGYRENFDLCVSRAVARLCVLTELCTPFVKNGGSFVSYKGADCDEEVEEAQKAIEILGCSAALVKRFNLFENGRSFVIMNKIINVSEKYPRREGIPAKKPLI